MVKKNGKMDDVGLSNVSGGAIFEDKTISIDNSVNHSYNPHFNMPMTKNGDGDQIVGDFNISNNDGTFSKLFDWGKLNF